MEELATTLTPLASLLNQRRQSNFLLGNERMTLSKISMETMSMRQCFVHDAALICSNKCLL
ncbi:hypothetical protein LguiA_007115 [Lonicera macranthoides]